MLEQLKNLDLDRIGIEDAVELSSQGRQIQTEFEALNVEQPAWLATRLRELRREIRVQQQDRIEKQLREAKARLEVLKPAEQKRTEVEAEIARLQALLPTP